MADRVSVQASDFQKDALGQGYDVTLIFRMLNAPQMLLATEAGGGRIFPTQEIELPSWVGSSLTAAQKPEN